ncbi:hypothetical protein [Desulfitibacter alkalitolerans]|uniref:hypothetical protein n=1 Tax=Desulfitibacter alkalitolerans TaxID=264641 RepID=UPI003BF4A43E
MCGNGGSGGNITINGGTVTAMGYQLSSGYKLGEGAGIGGGKGANGGTITIEGGIETQRGLLVVPVLVPAGEVLAAK